MNNTTKTNKKKYLNKKNLIIIFSNILSRLENIEFLRKYVNTETAFTRNRKMPLNILVKLLFAKAFLSLTIFLSIEFDEKKQTITKQAYSKARLNIKPQLFIDLNSELINEYYSDYNVKKYNNKYILLSIDGTILELPNTSRLRNEFGHTKGQKGAKEIARASSSCIYDSLNDLIITSTIDKYNTSERQMAKKMIMDIEESSVFKGEELLYIMDRGYFSKELVALFFKMGSKFLMRVSKTTLKTYFDNIKTNDEWIEIPIKEFAKGIKDEQLKEYILNREDKVKLRLTKIILPSGEEERLISNIEDVKYYKMKKLYFKRWRIEENYKFLKTRLKIENFSGKNEITIKQDFYSGILNANIQYLIFSVSKKRQTEKHEYQANKNATVGLYKEYILKAILKKKETLIKNFKIVIKLVSTFLIIKTSEDKTNERNIDDKKRANMYYTNLRPN